MKSIRTIFFLALCLVVQAGFSQNFEIIKGDTVNRIDENGMRQGRWLVKGASKKMPGFSGDAIAEEAYYTDNKKQGLRKQFYPDGKIKTEISFEDNIPKGESRTYFANGNISEIGTWKNGSWDGVYRYFYEDGTLSYEWNFVNGKREGEQKYYWPNGKLNYIGRWENGAEKGVVKEFNDNGLLVAERNFNEGKLEESSSKYYSTPIPDPTIAAPVTKSPEATKGEIEVFTGKGYYKINNKNGQVAKEGYFNSGQLVDGKQFHYSNDGKLVRTIIYKEGKVQQTIEEK